MDEKHLASGAPYFYPGLRQDQELISEADDVNMGVNVKCRVFIFYFFVVSEPQRQVI